MSRTKPIVLRVPVKTIEKDDETGKAKEVERWLGVDGELKEEESEAAVFRFRRSATPLERRQIEMVLHDMMPNGIAGWVDLQRGIEKRRERINQKAIDRIWPEGRPDVTGADLLAQRETIAKEWENFIDHPLVDQLGVLTNMAENLRFYAAWQVLGVNHPEGWDTLHDRDDLDDDTIRAIEDAWEKALGEVSAESPRLSA